MRTSTGLSEEVRSALDEGHTIDITTHGRRSGRPRRVEIVFHNIDGRIYISGRPGFPRSWMANLRANPQLTFHLKGPVDADLPAVARPITDLEERRRVLEPISRLWGYGLELMMTASPLIEVTFEEPLAA